MNPKFTSIVLALAVWLAVADSAYAQGTAFTYQGRLNVGTNAANGSYDLRFILYNADPGGSQQGPILTNSATSVSDGTFTVALDFGASFSGADRWLEIAVRTNGSGAFATLSPRQKLAPTPYAVLAGSVSGTLASQNLAGTYGGAVNFTNGGNTFMGAFTGNGGGLTNVNAASLTGTVPAAALSNAWKLGGNAGTTSNQFLGTTDNQPLEFKVNGVRALRLEPTANDAHHSDIVNLVGGSPANYIAPGVYRAVVAGGGAANYFGIPFPNSVAADFGAIGGGSDNTIQDNAYGSTIGGGEDNTIHNNAYGSTIAGGEDNTIQINAHASAIGGGEFNNVRYGQYATIAGGSGNLSGNAATSKGNYASVGGGQTDVAEGNYSTVPGGVLNYAAGAFSFAAGRRAKALSDGSFVWADSTDADFGYLGANIFQVRASGGVLFFSDTAASIGVYLAPGGNSWAPTSDRNAKENFRQIDPQEILAKVAALPVLDYNLKSQTNTIRHLGPMAQDFAAAFGLGEDDKHIATVDADGVALAAIQGLDQKVEEKEARIKELEDRLERLERLVNHKSEGVR